MTLDLGRLFAEVSQNVRHAFVSTKTQSTNVTRVSKNEWNAIHSAMDVEMGLMSGLHLDTVDVGTTEPFGGPLGTEGENRWQKRLTAAVSLRIQVTVITASAGAALVLQYTTDLTGASGWTTTGASQSLATVGVFASSWVAAPALAIADTDGVLHRWVITA